jgi:hypothetical protein
VGHAALIAFTLGAAAVARTNGGPVEATDDSRLCCNSAGAGAACLPPPADFEAVSVPSSAPPSPFVSTPTPASAAPASPAPAPTSSAPLKPSKAPTSKKAGRPARAVGVACRTGAQVAYQGNAYACLHVHTSQVDWSPVAAPALWSRVS